MNEVQGLSGFGGIGGYMAVTVWPNSRVLERLEAIIVHELHHHLRYSPGGIVWNPATVTAGEHVISEGLADVFASELYGRAPHGRRLRSRCRSRPGLPRRDRYDGRSECPHPSSRHPGVAMPRVGLALDVAHR